MRIRKPSNYRMLIELLLGIGIYGILGQLLILIFAKGKLYESVGFLAGLALAVVMIIHMAIAIENSVELEEEGALKYIRKTYIIRIVCLLVVFLLLFFLKLGDVVAALFGILSLKVSAYLQPFTHKVTQKFNKKGW